MVEKKLSLEVDINKQEADKSVKSIKQELREAKEEAFAMARKFGELSPEAIKAQKKLASLRDEMEDLNQAVQGLNPDKFQRIATLTNGLVRGFQTAQGAMVMFGLEGENIEKTIAKLQATMAMADGIQGVLDARKQFAALGSQIAGPLIKAVKSFGAATRAALISTGIGAFLVALGAIIAYWDEIKEVVTGVDKEQQKNLDTLKKEEKETGLILDNHKKTHEQQVLTGKTEKEILETEIKITDELIEQKELAISAQEAAAEKAIAARQKLFDKWGGRVKVFGFDTPAELKKEYDELIKIDKEALGELKENRAKNKNQLKGIEKTEAEKRKVDAKKTEEEINAIKNEINDETLKRLIERRDKELEAEKNLIKWRKELKEKEKELDDEINMRQLVEVADFNQKMIDDVKTRNAKVEELNKTYWEKQLAAAVAQEKAEQEIREAGLANIESIGRSIQILGSKNKAFVKAGLIVENAVGVAKIVINTQTAASKSMATFPGPVGLAFAAANYTAGALAVAASIKATNDALKQIGGGSAGGAGAISMGGSNYNAPRQAGAVGYQQIRQPQGTSNNMGGKKDNIRVVVVQKDLTDGQKKANQLQAKVVVK